MAPLTLMRRREVVTLGLFIWLIIRLIQLVFQPEQYFSLTKNQPTVFFSRLIIPAERLLCDYRDSMGDVVKDNAH
jgi:hypothetical protein